MSTIAITNRCKAIEMMARSSTAVGLTPQHRTLLEDAIEQDLNTDAHIASEIERL
jgi:hypothetical protein